jgi:hypothetical protein
MARRNERILIAVLLLALIWAPASWAISWQAGEAGIQIVWRPNVANSGNAPFNMSTATVTVLWQLGDEPSQSRPCLVSADGQSATYILTATDFTIPGTYHAQFEAWFNGQLIRKSPIFTATVNQSIPPTPIATPTATPTPQMYPTPTPPAPSPSPT